MQRSRGLSLVAGLALLGIAWLASCSNPPSGPGSNAYPNPEFVRVAAPRGSFGSGPSGPLSGSAQINGNKGGNLKVGRFRVDVPAGAFPGNATITVNVPDQTVLVCDLGITPAGSNNFALPVTLTTDWSGTNVVDPTMLVELWYDESAAVWRMVPGSTVDVARSTISTPLLHFSSYGTAEGKSGW
jgi:hypothetical protein